MSAWPQAWLSMDSEQQPDIVRARTMKKQKNVKHSFHLQRLGLFAVVLLAFFLVRFDAHGSFRSTYTPAAKVLAYATEMSRGSLLADTNTARAQNGLGPLALNDKLDSSAQAKANDMAAKNYWAHVSPDGTQPWYFFSQAGYNYLRAGENLAYGFSTSQGTVDGWMNSPSHRENVLGDYTDVGFGFIDVPDYQNSGNETIVVAHYGAPVPAPAPVAAVQEPSAPAATTPSTSAPQTSPDTGAPSQTATSPETTTPSSQNTPVSTTTSPQTSTTAKQTGGTVQTAAKSSRVSVLSMLANQTLPAAALISLSLVCLATVGYALTHRVAFHHAVTTGEHFVAMHPGMDTIAVSALTALILLTTYGHVG